jgi:hypothetical protein
MHSLIFDEIRKKHSDKIIDDINKKKFYNMITNVYGFDISKTLYIKKLPSETIDYFNKSLRQAKNTLNLNIYEMLLFIDEDFDSLNVLLTVIDNRNKQIIKDELAEEYGIDYSNTVLPEIIW